MGLAISGLILYALIDRSFDAEFKRMIKASRVKRSAAEVQKITDKGLYLVPADTASAYRRAQWILENLEFSDGIDGLSSLLFAYLNNEEPKPPKRISDKLYGISSPGFDPGSGSQRMMVLVLNKDFILKGEPADMAEKASRACIEALSPFLTYAKYNRRNMEPDIAEWMGGKREISFYSADEKILEKIVNNLAGTEIVSAARYNDGRPAVLAVIPAANHKYIRSVWDMNLLK